MKRLLRRSVLQRIVGNEASCKPPPTDLPAWQSHLNEIHQGQEMELSNYASQLLLQLNQQRAKGFLCDVVVMVDNTLFRAHKSVLAAASSYFKSLVLHDNLIHLDAELVDPGVFQKILDFIYTGKLSDEGEVEHVQFLSAFLTVANYLQLHDLASLCSSKLESGKSSSFTQPCFIKREADDTLCNADVYANMVPPKKRHNGEARRSSSKPGFGLDTTKRSSSRCAVNNLNSLQDYVPSAVSKTSNSLRSGLGLNGSSEKIRSLERFDGLQEWRTPPKGRSRRKTNVNGYYPVIKGANHSSQSLNFTSETNDEQDDEHAQEQPEDGGACDGSANFVYRQEPYLKPSQEDNPYVCIPCGKGFPSSESLNSHVESHLSDLDAKKEGEDEDEDPAANGLQDVLEPEDKPPSLKSFKELDALRPFPCDICGKMFTQRGTMTRHMRSHLGLKPFACEECGMRFTRQYRLTEHMRVHSGEKPYECRICGGKFTQQRNLLSHMRMHTSPI